MLGVSLASFLLPDVRVYRDVVYKFQVEGFMAMKKEKSHQLPRKSYDADVVAKIIVAFFAGVVGAVLVMSIYLDHQNRRIAATPPPSTSSHTHDTVSSVPAYGEQVNRVAAWFNCPCSDHCGDALDTCSCSAPRGAVEIKGFIQTQLDAGKKENDVVKLVQQKYGGLKPTMKEKFKAL